MEIKLTFIHGQLDKNSRVVDSRTTIQLLSHHYVYIAKLLNKFLKKIVNYFARLSI